MPENVSEDEAAYGLLWRMRTTDPRVHAARHALREKIGKEGQARGITWARQVFGETKEPSMEELP
jgi:hypothetical protein